jgi:murein DD-endopeptidase MepM/ murein hydrolase activator NlpD
VAQRLTTPQAVELTLKPPFCFGTSALINRLVTAKNDFWNFSSQAIKQYPKRITAVIAALMLGGGGGSFAVANFAPDASELPVREVVESVQSLPFIASDSLGAQSFNLYRSETTRSSDTADTLMKRLGVDDPAATAFIRSDAQARLLLGRGGRSVTAETTANNSLLKLSARWTTDDNGDFKRLVLEKTPQGFQSRLESAPLTATSQLASGTIQTSLFAATDDAKIPDAIAIQVAEIFSSDIDFHRALRKGDRFSVVYESLQGDGESLRTGRVLSAEFVNNGKTFQAMWFQDPAAVNVTASVDNRNKGGYFTLDGRSLRRSFLASPMEFSRVSSGFKMRFHPILQTWKAHLGIDYAAPTGTPVRSIGNGTVEFAGVQNGFGNVVFINHGNNRVTVYGHLSRINVRKGQTVAQSQNIGAVGATGWATGPHLHFEFRINGTPTDPMTIARQSEAVSISATAKASFDQAAGLNRQALVSAASMQVASAQ